MVITLGDALRELMERLRAERATQGKDENRCIFQQKRL